MHSFLILGDTNVHSIRGQDLARDFSRLSTVEDPKIYEGAAFAGLAIQQCLKDRFFREILEDESFKRDYRVCRYSTPLDAFNDWFRKHPFGCFENFSALRDPMRDASLEWTAEPKAFTDNIALQRLRLSEEKVRGGCPFGVHSWAQLESVRPGGLFSYSQSHRLYRSVHDEVRTICLQAKAMESLLPGTMTDEQKEYLTGWISKLQNLSTQIKNEVTPHLGDMKAEFKSFQTSISKLDAKSINKLSLQDLGQASKSLVATLGQLMYQQARESDDHQRLPEVVVLYDLFQGSKLDVMGESRRTNHRNGLRSVRFPACSSSQVTKNTQEKATDVVRVIKAWLATAHGSLRYFAQTQIKDIASHLSSPNAEVRSAETDLSKLVQELTKSYANEFLLQGLSLEFDEDDDAFDVMDVETDGGVKKPLGELVQEAIDDGDTWTGAAHASGVTEESIESGPRNPLFESVIRLAVARLSRAQKVTENKSMLPKVQPLIICCLKTLEMPDLEAEYESSNGPTVNYLTKLYREQWLRERTVLILDGDFLRMANVDPAGISSETSWEQTALDTIDAFQRRPRLKPYLHFGYLIIRYGVSGALLLCHQAGGDLSARLFFDPHKNDRDWSKPESGEVLGYTSIFAASIAQAVAIRCDQRKSEPVTSDILDSLLLGIRFALTRCQMSCGYGYGKAFEHREKLTKSEIEAYEAFYQNNGILPGLFLPQYDNTFEEWTGRELKGRLANDGLKKFFDDMSNVVDRHVAKWISSSIVPAVGVARWSIVDQSCRSNIEDVAFRITKIGVDRALNKRIVTIDDLRAFASRVSFDACRLRRAGQSVTLEQLQTQIDAFWVALLNGNEPQPRDDEHRRKVKKALSRVEPQLSKIVNEINSSTNPPSHNICGQMEAVLRDISAAVSETKASTYAMSQQFTLHAAPIGQFGKKDDLKKREDYITVIDRREVEGISAVQRLIDQYVHTYHKKTAGRPLSIAVFGPPGSGKSTAVKRIAKAHGEKISYDKLEFNLSQFTNVSQLDDAFEDVSKRKGCIPLAFFDEFDSKFEDIDFGWLKYFLAPMEDGKFGKHLVGPAILIFAGGTCDSFHSFSPKTISLTDQRWIEFSRAKGPDFVSRLSGHLNIIGIDPTDPNDEIWLLRRAVLLREIMEAKKLVDDAGFAKVDDDRVLRAILHAPSYRYGGRSIRMLIEACMAPDGWIRRSHVPASHELDMMVDSKSFLSVLRDNWR